MCVFVSRPMKIVTFLLKKTVRPQNGLLISLWKETHSETKSWNLSRILTKKVTTTTVKPGNRRGFLCVNPNFLIFLSFFIIFLHFFIFLFFFFSFFLFSFSHFFSFFDFFFRFFHFFIFFIFFIFSFFIFSFFIFSAFFFF